MLTQKSFIKAHPTGALSSFGDSMKICQTSLTVSRRLLISLETRRLPKDPRRFSIPRTWRQFSDSAHTPSPTKNQLLSITTCSKCIRREKAVVLSRSLSTSSVVQAGTMKEHHAMVESVSAAVREFYDRGEKFRISHGSTNSTRPSTQKRNVVDTSRLNRVLKVDTATKTALVEPNVPMDRLVEATMKYGLVPPVVMEFPGITVGGGYSGTSGESSSFKHGYFNKIINYVEMVLANGDIVIASETENADLFHGAAGAVGSFGVTTLVELQLHDATKYVETTYHPVSNIFDATKVIKEMTANPDLDYVDGIMFSKQQGAIITGRMTNDIAPGLPIQRFSNARDPWFYLHVQDAISKKTGPITEAIPLAEYLFRYDRGGFWVGASAFEYFNMPFNRFTRWLLDDFLHTRMMYTALHASGQSKVYIVQDLALPYETVEEFVHYTHHAFGIYPLWLCPLKQSPLPTMHPHSNSFEADGKTLAPLLNIGLWGPGPEDFNDFIALNRHLEHRLRKLGGMKWLYAHTYYEEAEFWQMYDKQWYDALREKYHATSLPSVYEKVKINVEAERRAEAEQKGWWAKLMNTWPLSGLWGIKKAIESGSYIAARKSSWKTI